MPLIQEPATKQIKREVLVRVIKAFYSDDFGEKCNRIPYDMYPKWTDPIYRCCIYKERAVVRTRVISALGGSLENDDEYRPAAEYAAEALKERESPAAPLTVIENACQGCAPAHVFVTELCQGCVARPCMAACHFGAISRVDGHARIDQAKCKKCGMCMQACPDGAIIKTVVPCENACPVGAIGKDEHGVARINHESCISCGKCVSACPFGAVNPRSQIIDVLSRIREGREVIAMVAPAIMGQLPCTAGQIHTALKKIGFSDVYEVAQGADVTARTEAVDLRERLARGDGFMTTSCCAAYNELVDKHLPELKPFRSATHTPMYYTGEIVHREHPDAVRVFISPCFAKRREALKEHMAEYVINFEEFGALLIALNIDVMKLEETPFTRPSSIEGRMYPLSGGVAQSVTSAWRGSDNAVKPTTINGLNKMSILDLKRWAKAGKCDQGNLVEVMSCMGGCIGGNACLNAQRQAAGKVKTYAAQSFTLKEDPSAEKSSS